MKKTLNIIYLCYIFSGTLSSEASTTADVVAKMDKLFDSVNAHTPDLRGGKPLSTNLQDNTPHLELFRHMREFFKNLKFLGCRRAPPSQEGWVWTLNGLERIWKNLKNKHKDIKSLATRRLQQDPLENLFGCIRGNCGANTKPTAGQFVAGLKTAVLSNLSHIVIGNCENDENEVFISNYKTLLAPDVPDDSTEDSIEKDMQHQINYTYEDSVREDDSGEIQACAYVCGFITKKNPNKTCQFCKKIFISDEQLAEHLFIDFKEYSEVKKSLIYATKELILCVERSATIVNNFLKNEAYKNNLKENVYNILKATIDYSFLDNCEAHKQSNVTYLMKSTFLICIKRFCTLKNRNFAEESSRAALRRKMDILQHK